MKADVNISVKLLFLAGFYFGLGLFCAAYLIISIIGLVGKYLI